MDMATFAKLGRKVDEIGRIIEAHESRDHPPGDRCTGRMNVVAALGLRLGLRTCHMDAAGLILAELNGENILMEDMRTMLGHALALRSVLDGCEAEDYVRNVEAERLAICERVKGNRSDECEITVADNAYLLRATFRRCLELVGE
jgi:hypothetical protein